MTYTPAFAERIEQEMDALSPRRYLRTGYSYAQFSMEFSRLIARAKKELPALEAAGFTGAELAYFSALLDALSLVHAARRNAAADVAAAKRQFMEACPAARERCHILRAAARYILSRDPTVDLHRAFADTRKGKSMVAVLNHTLTLIALLRRRPDLAAQVRPNGIVLDEQHLAEVETATLALLRQKGAADVAADSVSKAIDRRARLMTLCIRAVRDLKLFAKLAYAADRDHYRNTWASPSSHKPTSKAAVSRAES